MSAWDRGRRPAVPTPQQLRAFKGVSVYATLAQLRDKMRAYPGIGRYAAELDVPESVPYYGPARDGHIRLDGTTPQRLIRCVRAVHR